MPWSGRAKKRKLSARSKLLIPATWAPRILTRWVPSRVLAGFISKHSWILAAKKRHPAEKAGAQKDYAGGFWNGARAGLNVQYKLLACGDGITCEVEQNVVPDEGKSRRARDGETDERHRQNRAGQVKRDVGYGWGACEQ